MTSGETTFSRGPARDCHCRINIQTPLTSRIQSEFRNEAGPTYRNRSFSISICSTTSSLWLHDGGTILRPSLSLVYLSATATNSKGTLLLLFVEPVQHFQGHLHSFSTLSFVPHDNAPVAVAVYDTGLLNNLQPMVQVSLRLIKHRRQHVFLVRLRAAITRSATLSLRTFSVRISNSSNSISNLLSMSQKGFVCDLKTFIYVASIPGGLSVFSFSNQTFSSPPPDSSTSCECCSSFHPRHAAIPKYAPPGRQCSLSWDSSRRVDPLHRRVSAAFGVPSPPSVLCTCFHQKFMMHFGTFSATLCEIFDFCIFAFELLDSIRIW